MKNKLLFLLACALLSACAKKTYLADKNTFSHHIKTIADSSAHRTSSTTDKTISFTNRSIDTNVIVTGKVLSGNLVPSKLLDKDTSAHFENEDLTLLLYIDKAGKATATAVPKLKMINVKASEQRAVYNNIIKKDEAEINFKSESAVKTSVDAKHIQKETTGNTLSFGWVMMILLACTFIWIATKFNPLGRLFG